MYRQKSHSQIFMHLEFDLSKQLFLIQTIGLPHPNFASSLNCSHQNFSPNPILPNQVFVRTQILHVFALTKISLQLPNCSLQPRLVLQLLDTKALHFLYELEFSIGHQDPIWENSQTNTEIALLWFIPGRRQKLSPRRLPQTNRCFSRRNTIRFSNRDPSWRQPWACPFRVGSRSTYPGRYLKLYTCIFI